MGAVASGETSNVGAEGSAPAGTGGAPGSPPVVGATPGAARSPSPEPTVASVSAAEAEWFADRIGHRFTDVSLLAHALAHRSWCAEAGGAASNERLEFLGDAVLGLVVAEHCFGAYPALPEGALAKVRAAVVNTAVLAEVAGELGVGDLVLLGRGEDASGGRGKPSILANTVEALIGAVYLDGGLPAASTLVLRLLGRRIEEAAAGPGADDYKTRLQEVVVRTVGVLPHYDVDGSGPDHDRRYRATVVVAGEPMGRGVGRSKKDAEQAAAREASLHLASRAAQVEQERLLSSVRPVAWRGDAAQPQDKLQPQLPDQLQAQLPDQLQAQLPDQLDQQEKTSSQVRQPQDQPQPPDRPDRPGQQEKTSSQVQPAEGPTSGTGGPDASGIGSDA